MFVFLHSNTRR